MFLKLAEKNGQEII